MIAKEDPTAAKGKIMKYIQRAFNLQDDDERLKIIAEAVWNL
jgi:hypothetical protein